MAITPNDNDVLSGRGVSFNQHPGNGHFRRMLDEQKDAYMAGTKKQKMDISKAIVEAIYSMDPPGRFLKKCSETGQWNELSRKDAADRAAQAMAYAIRSKDISERRKEERRRSRRISQRPNAEGNGGNNTVAASLQLHHADRLPTQHQRHSQSSNNRFVGNPSSSLSSAPRHRLASRGPAARKTQNTTRSSAMTNDCTDSLADEMPRVPSNSNSDANNLHRQLQLLPPLNQNSAASTNTLPTSSIAIDQNVSQNQNGLVHVLTQAVQQQRSHHDQQQQQQQQLHQSDLGQLLLGQLLHTQTALQSASLEGLTRQQLLAQAQQQQQLIQQHLQQQVILLQHLLNQQNVHVPPSDSLRTTLSVSAPSSASQGLLPPNGMILNGNGALSSNYSTTPQSEPAAHVNISPSLQQQSNPSSNALLLSSLLSNLQQHPNSVGIISAPQGAQQLEQLQPSLVLQHVQQLMAPSLNLTPTNQSFGQQQQSQIQLQLQLDPSHQSWQQVALPLQVQSSQGPHSINPQPSGNTASASTRREEDDADEMQSVSEKK